MLNEIGFIWTPHLKKKREGKDDDKSYAEHTGSPSSVGGEDEGKGLEMDSDEEEVVMKKSKPKRCKIEN
jgi:hypothetical protein